MLGVEDGALGEYGLNALTRRLKMIGVSLDRVTAPGPASRRRAAAEGIAAFALVFAGCGAIVTDADTAARSARSAWRSSSAS